MRELVVAAAVSLGVVGFWLNVAAYEIAADAPAKKGVALLGGAWLLFGAAAALLGFVVPALPA